MSSPLADFMSAERRITFRRLPPGGQSAEEVIPVSDLFRRDSLFLSYIWSDRDLPSLEETNRILQQGRGDDGHFVHVWQPVQLTEEEYEELRQQVRTLGPEKFVAELGR